MRVLVAEDDPIARRLLDSYLRQWGHEVAVAADGTEAWSLFQDHAFPLVLTDWVMPGMDGLELIAHIRRRPEAAYVYIILLTAKSQKEDVIAGIDAGANDFVSKPFDRGELRVRLLAGERVVRLEQTLAEQNRALREAQAALVQSEKLASLGQLAAGMAHEVNNPLAYVINNLAVLRRDVAAALDLLARYRSARPRLAQIEPALAAELARTEDDSDMVETEGSVPRLFDRSLEGLKRVRDIVRNLQDFARLGEAEFKEADLNEGVRSTLEIIRYEVKKKALKVETHLGELPPVQCHAGKINQVFLNLLVNAVHACEPGGSIEVRTRREDGGRPGVVIEVVDNGCGIPAEHMPRLFDPFFTTKPIGQGTGLGLAVSYGIVRDHGGRIEVESAPGHGSLFRVRLPLRPPGLKS
jgi:two-component system NtrC family sensor kinase